MDVTCWEYKVLGLYMIIQLKSAIVSTLLPRYMVQVYRYTGTGVQVQVYRYRYTGTEVQRYTGQCLRWALKEWGPRDPIPLYKWGPFDGSGVTAISEGAKPRAM